METGTKCSLGDITLMPHRAWIFSALLGLVSLASQGWSQESQWQSLAGEGSAMGRKVSPEKMDYNLDLGPVLLNVGASLSAGYNSNTGLTQNGDKGSGYTTPAGNLSLMWPITDLNMLTFSVGFGYSYYFDVAETNSPGGFFIALPRYYLKSCYFSRANFTHASR